MSVRSEGLNTPQLTAAGTGMPAVRTEAAADALATISAAQNIDPALAEANEFTTNNPEHPLKRSVVVSVRASLEDLCLRKAKATWSPSAEATATILKQQKFIDLQGTSEKQGDLKSVVLHKMAMRNVKSSFPVSLGAQITGVDANTYSITGNSFSTIVLPGEHSQTSVTLQEDDCSLAYEFGKKFPGYTAENLTEKGVHEVQARRFCLIAADHPLVSAISENAERLQMGEISMMPEGLVKISTQLYETIMPMVKAQVESQIKVRDMSNVSVSLEPAEFSSWQEARTSLMAEAKAGLKAKLEAELASMANESQLDGLRDAFSKEERELEHTMDHQVHTFSAILDLDYNFLSK